MTEDKINLATTDGQPRFLAVGTYVNVIIDGVIDTQGIIAEFFVHESGREYYRLDTPRFPWLYRVPACLVFPQEGS
ncbi:hypothetical protein fHeYen902_033c [Yersinia phage fHe-Yen9-02]|nr:hypothetical protein fHeYen902_033c [Yersinia phage fHe-Yen9-02]